MSEVQKAPSTEPFIKLPRDVLMSDSWRLLSINARRFLDFLMIEHMRQGGKRNGFLLAPRRQLYAFGIGAHFITDAIDELERGGLVDCQRGVGRRPSSYTLTWLPMADGSAPIDRWRSVVDAVSTQNECQTASTKPVAAAKQHSQRPKSSSAKQHPPSRTSYQGGDSLKEEEGYGTPVAVAAVVREQPSTSPGAPTGKPNGGEVAGAELDRSRRCGRYVTNAVGFRICGNSVVAGADHCSEHAPPPIPDQSAPGKRDGRAAP